MTLEIEATSTTLPGSKIIVLSQDSSVEVVEAALSRGVQGYVYKAQQRLLIESPWRQHESPDNWIKDPPVKKIVERICEEVAARGANKEDVQPG